MCHPLRWSLINRPDGSTRTILSWNSNRWRLHRKNLMPYFTVTAYEWFLSENFSPVGYKPYISIRKSDSYSYFLGWLRLFGKAVWMTIYRMSCSKYVVPTLAAESIIRVKELAIVVILKSASPEMRQIKTIVWTELWVLYPTRVYLFTHSTC